MIQSQGPWDPSLIQIRNGRPYCLSPYQAYQAKIGRPEMREDLIERMSKYGSEEITKRLLFLLPFEGSRNAQLDPIVNNAEILRPLCQDWKELLSTIGNDDIRFKGDSYALGCLLHRLAQITRDDGDIEASQHHAMQILCDLPEQDDLRAYILLLLAENSSLVSDSTFQISDANKALLRAQESLALFEGVNKPQLALRTFARILKHRYSLSNELSDLQSSAKYLHKALEATQSTPNEDVGLYHDLAIVHMMLYARASSEIDFEQADFYGKQAMSGLPEHTTQRALVSNNLSHLQYIRYVKSHLLKDIDGAITASETAVSCATKIEPDYPQYLQFQANCLFKRFEKTKSLADLNRSIKLQEDAKLATSRFLPNHCAFLGEAYRARAKLTKNSKDLVQSMLAFARGSQDEPSPLTRILCVARCCSEVTLLKDKLGPLFETVVAMVEEAQDTILLAFHRTSSRKDTQFRLERLAGVSSKFASVLVETGAAPLKLLEFLEESRGIMISSILESRSDALGLREKNFELWQRHTQYRNSLGVLNSKALGQQSDRNYADIIQKIEQLREEWEVVLEEIRTVPGFERFLMLPTEKELHLLAREGPLVTFNISNFTSSAIIVTEKDIQCLKLPGLNYRDVEHWVKIFASRGNSNRRDAEDGDDDDEDPETYKAHQSSSTPANGLLYLWSAAVEPVLRHLNFLQAGSRASSLPKIFWVGGGMMSLLPLHAAGDHSLGSTKNTMSCVISSFVSTFKTLQFIRSRPPISITDTEQNVSVITMPFTPGGHTPLRVMEEAAAIEKSSHWTSCNTMTQPCRTDVIAALETCTIAHFACHGNADRVDPSSSALLVGNHSLEKVTVEDLDAVSCQKARLVYLSACSTAKVSALRLADEGIHLATSFQLIGFRHVIGTLWGADDHAAVEIAKTFYEALPHFIDNGFVSVSQALHHAILSFKNNGDNWKDCLKWAPFVHFGC